MVGYSNTIVRLVPEHDIMMQEWLTSKGDFEFISRARDRFKKDLCINISRVSAGYCRSNFYEKAIESHGYKFITSEDFLKAEGIIETELIW